MKTQREHLFPEFEHSPLTPGALMKAGHFTRLLDAESAIFCRWQPRYRSPAQERTAPLTAKFAPYSTRTWLRWTPISTKSVENWTTCTVATWELHKKQKQRSVNYGWWSPYFSPRLVSALFQASHPCSPQNGQKQKFCSRKLRSGDEKTNWLQFKKREKWKKWRFYSQTKRDGSKMLFERACCSWQSFKISHVHFQGSNSPPIPITSFDCSNYTPDEMRGCPRPRQTTQSTSATTPNAGRQVFTPGTSVWSFLTNPTGTVTPGSQPPRTTPRVSYTFLVTGVCTHSLWHSILNGPPFQVLWNLHRDFPWNCPGKSICIVCPAFVVPVNKWSENALSRCDMNFVCPSKDKKLEGGHVNDICLRMKQNNCLGRICAQNSGSEDKRKVWICAWDVMSSEQERSETVWCIWSVFPPVSDCADAKKIFYRSFPGCEDKKVVKMWNQTLLDLYRLQSPQSVFLLSKVQTGRTTCNNGQWMKIRTQFCFFFQTVRNNWDEIINQKVREYENKMAIVRRNNPS